MGQIFFIEQRKISKKMKLSAAILFASANAQNGGRVRDKDVSEIAAAYDSYNAGFGDDAYGGFYDAFADAFGDSGNYGDYGYDNADDATAAPAAVDAGRPVEVVEEDDVKTVFLDGLEVAASDPLDGGFSQKCWVARGTSSDDWFDPNVGSNGWKVCNGGEHQACEIKVTRNKANAITQIVSKCANQQSCVDNMKQNFNPAAITAAGSALYGTYAQQQWRPQFLAGANSALFGARQKASDSVCFFCVEPCDVDDPTTLTAAQLRTNNCIGTGDTDEENSKPFDGNDLDLLGATDDTLDTNVYDGTDLTTASDFFNMNWYSTVEIDMKSGDLRETRTVSRIQHYQLSLVDDDNVPPFPAK